MRRMKKSPIQGTENIHRIWKKKIKNIFIHKRQRMNNKKNWSLLKLEACQYEIALNVDATTGAAMLYELLVVTRG